MKGAAGYTNPDDVSTAGRRPRSAASPGSVAGRSFLAVLTTTHRVSYPNPSPTKPPQPYTHSNAPAPLATALAPLHSSRCRCGIHLLHFSITNHDQEQSQSLYHPSINLNTVDSPAPLSPTRIRYTAVAVVATTTCDGSLVTVPETTVVNLALNSSSPPLATLLVNATLAYTLDYATTTGRLPAGPNPDRSQCRNHSPPDLPTISSLLWAFGHHHGHTPHRVD